MYIANYFSASKQMRRCDVRSTPHARDADSRLVQFFPHPETLPRNEYILRRYDPGEGTASMSYSKALHQSGLSRVREPCIEYWSIRLDLASLLDETSAVRARCSSTIGSGEALQRRSSPRYRKRRWTARHIKERHRSTALSTMNTCYYIICLQLGMMVDSATSAMNADRYMRSLDQIEGDGTALAS